MFSVKLRKPWGLENFSGGCFLIYILLLLSSCNTSPDKDKKIRLQIATAASAQFVMKEITSGFVTENSNVTIDIISGSSGKLTAQILNGAPFDIFFSADSKYPNTIFEGGKASNKPLVYAYGIPVIWTMDSTIILSDDGKFLLNNTIDKIVIANPKSAPFGEMALKYLQNKGVYDSIKTQLVYGENISQVNEYILNKTADIGFSAKSVVISPDLIGKGKYVELGTDYQIAHCAVVLKGGNNTNEIKQKFIDYVLSEKGREILKKYGYRI